MFFGIGKGWGSPAIGHIYKKQFILFQHFPVIFCQSRIHGHIHHTFRLCTDGMHPYTFYDGEQQGKKNSRNQGKINRNITFPHSFPLSGYILPA